MCRVLQVRWTITPKSAPQPWLACNGCGALRPFRSSDKVRLNANGRRLDAWLIYRCTTCDKTWNRTIFERRPVGDIEPAVLAALQANDADWIRAEAFDLAALRRKSQRIDECADLDVRRQILCESPDWRRLDIELVVPFSTATRLDRLLAAELKISRSRLKALHEDAVLRIEPGRVDILRRRIVTGIRVTVDRAALGAMSTS